MNATIRTRTGRLHLAEQASPYWLAVCGSVIVHTLEKRPAVSPAEFVGMDDTVCAYCRAIGRAVLFAELIAAEAITDAGRVAPRVGARLTTIPRPIPSSIP